MSQAADPPAGGTLVYVGTYTGAKSKGIYLLRLETGATPQDVRLVPLGLAAATPSPSFLALDYERRRLYAVNEVDEFDGKPTGSISAFSIDPATGKLTLINTRPSMGRSPCHLILDKTGRHLLVANYGSGTVAVLPVATDGSLGEPTSVVQHAGKSVNPKRQEGPHAHCFALDGANRFAFACDLGLDKILVYRFDAATGTLTPHDPPFAAVKPGGGPRHMAFRPDGRFAYVLNELHSTVTTFAYDANAGTLTELQTVSTLPTFDGSNSGAEIAVHPSGKYVYTSNRGHDSIALFNVDGAKGTLTFVEAASTGGRTPRHFGIEPGARYMAIGNQATDSVMLGRIDPATGRITPAALAAPVPTPVCLVFLAPQPKR